MDFYWIGLVLVSALLHPLRDLILKGTAQPMLCYAGVSVVWVVLAVLAVLALRAVCAVWAVWAVQAV